MKLAIVASPFLRLETRGYGAVERVIIERTLALSAAGYDVTLVATSLGAAQPSRYVAIRPIKGRFPTTLEEKVRWSLSPRAYMHALPYLSANLDDVDVVINDGAPMDPFNTYLMARVLGVSRTLNILHGGLGIDKPWFRPFAPLAKRLRYGVLNLGFCQVLESRGYVASYTPSGTIFPPSSEVIVAPDNQLIHIGKVCEFKGTHIALQIAAKLGMPLVIIGPIGDRRYFEERVRPRLGRTASYLGEVPRERLIQYLRRSAALVFTSTLDDPQGLVLLEALSYGVPIIASRPGPNSGVYDILQEGENGVFVDPAAPDLHAITRILTIDRKRIQEAAYENWDWSNVIIRHYRRVLAAPE